MPRSFILAASLIVGLLAGCSNDDARIEAAQVRAADLATALAEGQVGDLPMAGGGQDQLAAVLSGMAGLPVEVTASDIVVDGDSAWDVYELCVDFIRAV